MSETVETTPTLPPGNAWDYESWQALGIEELERRYRTKSATNRDILRTLLRNLDDPSLKLALLGLVGQELYFATDRCLTEEDKGRITQEDEVAAKWIAQKEMRRQDESKAYKKSRELIPQLRHEITEHIGAHPNLRLEHPDGSTGRAVIVGDFKGVYQGKEMKYRLVAPASSNGTEVDQTVWLELPQTPEPFEPAYVDFGSGYSQDSHDFSNWRESINGPVVLVGTSLRLSGDHASGDLILNSPNAPELTLFGNLPPIDPFKLPGDERLPVAFDYTNFAMSSAGQKTLIYPSLTQLEELQELIATSRPIEIWEDPTWQERYEAMERAYIQYQAVQNSQLDRNHFRHPANTYSGAQEEWDKDWDNNPEWVRMELDVLRRKIVEINEDNQLDEDAKLWQRDRLSTRFELLARRLERAGGRQLTWTAREALRSWAKEAIVLCSQLREGVPKPGTPEEGRWITKHNPPLGFVPPYDPAGEDDDP